MINDKKNGITNDVSILHVYNVYRDENKIYLHVDINYIDAQLTIKNLKCYYPMIKITYRL